MLLESQMNHMTRYPNGTDFKAKNPGFDLGEFKVIDDKTEVIDLRGSTEEQIRNVASELSDYKPSKMEFSAIKLDKNWNRAYSTKNEEMSFEEKQRQL